MSKTNLFGGFSRATKAVFGASVGMFALKRSADISNNYNPQKKGIADFMAVDSHVQVTVKNLNCKTLTVAKSKFKLEGNDLHEIEQKPYIKTLDPSFIQHYELYPRKEAIFSNTERDVLSATKKAIFISPFLTAAVPKGGRLAYLGTLGILYSVFRVFETRREDTALNRYELKERWTNVVLNKDQKSQSFFTSIARAAIKTLAKPLGFNFSRENKGVEIAHGFFMTAKEIDTERLKDMVPAVLKDVKNDFVNSKLGQDAEKNLKKLENQGAKHIGQAIEKVSEWTSQGMNLIKSGLNPVLYGPREQESGRVERQ